MASLAVSVLDELGAVLTSAEFATPKAARDFVEWRIEELLYEGAEYVVVADTDAQTEAKYRAARIADCIYVARDWRYALVREAA